MSLGVFDAPKVVSAAVGVIGLVGALFVFSMSRASVVDVEKAAQESFSRRDGERLERAIERFADEQRAITRIVLDVQAEQKILRAFVEQRDADKKK